jgi:outer membrane protein assembly factor BamA
MAVSVLGIQRDAYNAANQNYYYDDYGNIVPYSYYEKHRLDSIKSITLSTQFVNDTTLWGYTGPVRGRRYLVSLEYSPKMGANDLQYATIEFDYRKYYRLNRKYDIVTRFSGGSSFGDTPRLFFLGGTDNWLNARIASIPGFIENQQSLFFARFPQPLRGYQYYKFYGNKYFLTNLEFRFPFIQYLAFGWPVPLVIGNISGVLFTDVGSVWDKYVLEADGQTVRSDGSFHGAGRVGNSLYLDDIKMSYGVGMRMNLGFAVVRLETAWKAFPQKQMLNNGTEVIRSDPKPVFYLSVGPEF